MEVLPPPPTPPQACTQAPHDREIIAIAVSLYESSEFNRKKCSRHHHTNAHTISTVSNCFAPFDVVLVQESSKALLMSFLVVRRGSGWGGIPRFFRNIKRVIHAFTYNIHKTH